MDLDRGVRAHSTRIVLSEILTELQLIYVTPEETREAGYLEFDHFGQRFNARRPIRSDLTVISQLWLRDLLWDFMAHNLRSARGPRSLNPYNAMRRACVELSAFLEIHALEGGHDPTRLGKEAFDKFTTDQLHRALSRLPSLIMQQRGQPATVSVATQRAVFAKARQIMRWTLESGDAERLGLPREFIMAFPASGRVPYRIRSPFTDETARTLVKEGNLQQLAGLDANDRGARDIWETIVATGRRCGEVVNLHWDCLGRYNGLPMLWHDQTKVGNYDQAVRIPERIHSRLRARQQTSLQRFEERHGRPPTDMERSRMALFPSPVANPSFEKAMGASWFSTLFRGWVDELDLGDCVPHQARHTMATRLLAAGAQLHHIKKFLGHVSEKMAEHYAKVAISEIEDILQHIWVAGPGTPQPGTVLSTGVTPLAREEATALALDLARHSTPAEGGFCTYQPVVDGGACPWKLNCHNCDKFVLSGADLLYWRRKREQWASIAERAPDDATADYLHQVFEPTARAIDGLEQALAGLGLLEDALALDLRRPQDYFHRLWNIAFRADDLAATADGREQP
ncbi:tyrosine-type recombinase/integrase [Actinomadura sp. NPDC023710]|uniref:tyrosine-type recombinase/integrase n=1 Tax=Actinomadura sp. NPDC023710 TaxID=3158219 RepID=UPI0033F5916A